MIKLKNIINEQSDTTERKTIINGMQDYSAFIENYPPIVNNVAREGVRFVDKIMYNPMKTMTPSFAGYAFGSIIGCIFNYRHYQWDLSGVSGIPNIGNSPADYEIGEVRVAKNKDLPDAEGIGKDADPQGFAVGLSLPSSSSPDWWCYKTIDGDIKGITYRM